MRRLWVRWTCLILFVAVLGTAFVNLGDWQLRRLHQRQQRNVSTVANEQDPVVAFDRVFTHTIVDADQWQRASATGTFDAAHQFVLRYRSNDGADGYEVVTPLQTPAGNVLVDRGFVELDQGQAIPDAAPAPPAGQVTVVGHVRRNEKGRSSATRPVDGQMRLISSDAIAPTLPYPVVNGYLGLLSVDPAQTGGFVPIVLPEISDGPHFWYAVQWFMFAGIGLAGVVVFIRGDIRARRAEQEAAAAPVVPQPTVSAAP
ncbi:SURF1 family protein [uncultured Friedmanniella sp.]|uniref:SURF1 family cytochrome oxidase biogenesis protein n=1 Tax=uncultured Friedmanniella sp. TaxID=335381 RepID=UPI0035CA9AAD